MKKCTSYNLNNDEFKAQWPKTLCHQNPMELGPGELLRYFKDSKNIVYKVTTPSVEENKLTQNSILFLLTEGTPAELRKQRT
jgi:hypothetical protein